MYNAPSERNGHELKEEEKKIRCIRRDETENIVIVVSRRRHVARSIRWMTLMAASPSIAITGTSRVRIVNNNTRSQRRG